MDMNSKLTVKLALSTTLGLALFLGVAPARAQYGMSGDNGMQGGMDMMGLETAPLAYPFAAPGTLHLYHWSDFTNTELVNGSVEDARMEKSMAAAKKIYPGDVSYEHPMSHDGMMHDGMMHDGMMHGMHMDPASLSYPFASPGSLHLFHWSDYTGREIMNGSPAEMREANEKMRVDKEMADMHRGMGMHGDMDMDMMDPAPLSYPFAAPGSLHLYHWSDYTMTELENGSADDKRMDNEHMKNKGSMHGSGGSSK